VSDERLLHLPNKARPYPHRELAELAQEAERGYDTNKLARRPGRPRMGSSPAVVVPVRLHAELHAAVAGQAAAARTSVSDLVRQALSAYLEAEPAKHVELRTRSGRILGESELSALASEAAAG
jgi:hypothetical protein